MKGRKVAVIGGSGIYQLEKSKLIKKHPVETPYGKPSSDIYEVELDGRTFFFIPRHGEGHKYLPSEVNYRANLYALKSLGVNVVLSVSAVGSLQEEFAPGTFVLPGQFLDWTKGQRARSFFGEGMVGHVSTAYPIELNLRNRISKICSDLEIKYETGGTYVCIEGPQFSSRAESEIYRGFGCSVIGMTNVPEAYLAKEAGMAYATIAMVTDYDCWKDVHCSVDEILKVMSENIGKAKELVAKVIPDLVDNPIEFSPENEHAVMTKPELLTAQHQEILEVLLS